jgi:hypothetical protein
MKHFCNQHNAYLRQKAHRENVQDLDTFIEAHVEGGREAQIDRIIDENEDATSEGLASLSARESET